MSHPKCLIRWDIVETFLLKISVFLLELFPSDAQPDFAKTDGKNHMASYPVVVLKLGYPGVRGKQFISPLSRT